MTNRTSTRATALTGAPITLRWHSQDVRVRHDDPRLNAYSGVVQRLASAMSITTEVATLRHVLARETAYEVGWECDPHSAGEGALRAVHRTMAGGSGITAGTSASDAVAYEPS